MIAYLWQILMKSCAHKQNQQLEMSGEKYIWGLQKFFILPYWINIRFNLLKQRMHLVYARMNTQIKLAFSFKCLIALSLCYNTCSLCNNTWKIFSACPIILVSFLCLVLIYNWNDAKTSTVNWYSSLSKQFYILWLLCVYVFYQNLVRCLHYSFL